MKCILITLIAFSSVYADTVELFDGKSLEGWRYDPKFWKVTDGIITGESTKENPCRRNTYVTYTKKEFANFELELSFRFLSEAGNSGIQYRSSWFSKKRISIKGYQADMEVGPKYNGILYELGGRKIVAERGQQVLINLAGKKTVSNALEEQGKKAQESIKHGEWNTYRVVADGNTLTHQINGFTTVSVTDNDREKKASKGLIALQLHVGPPMKVQFKDIKLLELNDTPTVAKPPQWIWADTVHDNQQVTFSKDFHIDTVPTQLNLHFSADDSATVLINGKEVTSSINWKEAKRVNVSSFLKKGLNSISIKAFNQTSKAGLCLKLGDILSSDESWTYLENHKSKLVKVVAAHGEKPWGKVLSEPKKDSVQSLPNFKVTKLHDVISKTQGSWVAMCFAPNGDLYVSDQYGSLYRIILANSEVKSITPLASPGHAQGICWAFGSLYITSHNPRETGLYRLTDTNKDGTFDKQELILDVSGRGEHGPHNIVVAEDGKSLYVMLGNKTPLPKGTTSVLNHNWDEDTLLKHLPDANGHAVKVRAPGGTLLKISPDGKKKEVIVSGLRNTYDLAINPQGEAFGYDSDMEWDVGTSWYRPTRILHLVKGAEFGWRTGTSKWPTFYPDSLGSVADIGPGSPTGVLFGTDLKFPLKYRKALYALDWTFGRMYAIHLDEAGSTYTGTHEVFLSGKPLPIADAAVGPDGAMYFVTGGRRLQSSLYRVEYSGKADETPLFKEPSVDAVTRKNLLNQPSIETAWKHLDSTDRTLSYTARVSLEQFPLKEWSMKFSNESSAEKVITAAIAFARLKGDPDLLYNKLLSIDYTELSLTGKLHYLRALGLGFIRSDKVSSEQKKRIASELVSHFPAKGNTENLELCKLLTYLEVDMALTKGASMMEASVTQAQNVDTSILDGNDQYGGDINKMLGNQPDTYALNLALILMNAKSGWNPQTVTKYFTWLNKAESKSGGKSYIGFIKNIRKTALLNVNPQYKTIIDQLPQYIAPKEKTPIAKGPGRTWSITEATETVTNLSSADRSNGERMYRAILCDSCHTFDGKGGSSGPDLSNLATRFEKKDILKAILEPSEVISEQYTFTEFTLKNGTTLTGKIMKEEDGKTHLAISAFDLSTQITVDTNEIVKRSPSKISPMPASLINALNPDELKDLIKYLTE